MKNKASLFTILFAVFSCGPILFYLSANGSRSTQGPKPVPSPQYKDWQLVAKSDVIGTGQLSVPVKSIQDSLQSSKYRYETLSLKNYQLIKGKSNKKVIDFITSTRPTIFSPQPKDIIGLDEKVVVVFLVYVNQPQNPRFYFAGHTPHSLLGHQQSIVSEISREVENQQRIIKSFPISRSSKPDNLHKKVASLIEQMVDPATESQAFEDLEKMGTSAVPSIIRLMDDRRPLPIKSITLHNNFPNAFEAARHYRPEVVADALSAILNQITGVSFGSIYNGGSEQERARTINNWRIYLYYSVEQKRA